MADDTERLINLVRERVFLYDPRQPAYKNVSKKLEAWEEIAHELRQNSETVKVKWKNLRDSYVKYLKFLRGDSGSKKKFRNWPWAPHMEFLHESLHLKTQPHDLQFLEEEISDGNYGAEMYTSDDSQMPIASKKFKTQLDTSSTGNMIRNVPNETENIHKNLDGNDLLFLSYAETFKKLPLQKQTIIKMKMSLMFGQAELDELGVQMSSTSFLLSLTCPSCKSNPINVENVSKEVNRDDADHSNSEPQTSSKKSTNWIDEVKSEI